MESVDFLLGNVDKQGQLEDDDVRASPSLILMRKDLREILDDGDGQVLRDYFTGGFDLRDLTRDTKTNGDGPILPGDDARDFSDEDSLADDEGDMGNQGGEAMDTLIQETQTTAEDEEDPMSEDLFGPDMSSHPVGQHFGADTLIALLGRDETEEHGLPWSDEPQEGIFDQVSPTAIRAQSDEEMLESPGPEKAEHQEVKVSAVELVKEWFPDYSQTEILRFTEIFGAKPAELNRPQIKAPRGILSITLF